jgi:thioredoxin 2
MSESLHIVCPSCDATNRVPEARLGGGPRCGKCKQLLFGGAPVELHAGNFARHINHSDIPVVVDFWAPWCGPCKMMAPVFAQSAAQLEPRVRLAKVNTEADQSLAVQFGIRSIPTLVIFRRGHETARQAGAMDPGTLSRWIRDNT